MTRPRPTCPSIRCTGCTGPRSLVGELLFEELLERGWTTRDLAVRMGTDDAAITEAAVDLILHIDDPALTITPDESAQMGRALGVSEEWLYKIHEYWRRNPQ